MPDRDLTPSAAAANGPPPWRIGIALAAMLALPVSSYFSGSSVGSYRMFTQPMEYRLQLEAVDARGHRRALPLEVLGPHLGLDARRLILPAGRPVFGETAASLLEPGLPDLARLACRVWPDAAHTRVWLARRDLHGPLPDAQLELACGSVRRAR